MPSDLYPETPETIAQARMATFADRVQCLRDACDAGDHWLFDRLLEKFAQDTPEIALTVTWPTQES